MKSKQLLSRHHKSSPQHVLSADGPDQGDDGRVESRQRTNRFKTSTMGQTQARYLQRRSCPSGLRRYGSKSSPSQGTTILIITTLFSTRLMRPKNFTLSFHFPAFAPN